MNKHLSKLVLVLLCLLANVVNAQTYIRTATGANNYFPLGTGSLASTNNRVQYLYYPSDFTPTVPMGVITKVYFKAGNTTTYTYNDMTLQIGTTTLTAMPTTATPWVSGLSTAYYASSRTITAVSGNWFEFTLTSPFFWDGTSNIIVDIYSASNGTIILEQGSLGGNRRMWGTYNAATSTSGGTGSASLALDIIPGSPCTKTTALAATNIASTRATVNWTPVPGSFKYEYVIDTTTPGMAITPITATTATSALVTGLYPNKTHYLRVRNYCSAISYSMWDTIAFTTLPPCKVPYGFVVSNVDSNSGYIQWTQDPNVTGYDILVDTFRNAPLSTNPNITTQTTNSKALTGLKEGRWQYVHIRAKCVQNDSSAWSLDSFYTPTPCRKPVPSLTYVNANNAIVAWSAVPTAYAYEYYFGSASSIPANGTPLIMPTLQMPYLQPKTGYSVHVRCMCSDNSIKTSSGWSSIDFTTTPALGIENANAGASLQIDAYPNPVKDILNIKATGLKGSANIQITDIKGRVMNSLIIDAEQTSLNVSHYAAGIYILQYTDNDKVQNIKFTKQ